MFITQALLPALLYFGGTAGIAAITSHGMGAPIHEVRYYPVAMVSGERVAAVAPLHPKRDLTVGELRRVVRRNWMQVRLCQRLALRKGGVHRGTEMAVTLAEGGFVERVVVASKDRVLKGCLERVARAWVFPLGIRPGRVVFPIVFDR